MAVVEALGRLNSSFRRSKLANADAILTDLRLLHRKGCKVPYRYYLESVKIFAFRRDVLRTELLLRMSQRNLVKPVLSESDLAGNRSSRKSTRSRPHHDSYQKLISFAVSGLIRSGAIEESMALWVRMSYGNNNYVTNRIGLEKIIEKVASGPNAVASLDLIEDMHQMIKFNRWDQRIGQRGHYNSMLKVMRKYLGSYIATESSEPEHISVIEEAGVRLSKLDAYWVDVKAAGYLDSSNNSSHSVALELQALRLQALVNLGAEVWRALRHANVPCSSSSSSSSSSNPEGQEISEEVSASTTEQREKFVAALQNAIAQDLRDLVVRFHQVGDSAAASEAKVLELVRRITQEEEGANTVAGDEEGSSPPLNELRSLLYEEPAPGADGGGKSKIDGLKLTSRPSASSSPASGSGSGNRGLQPLNPHHSAAWSAGHRETLKSIRGALLFLATHGQCLDGSEGEGEDKQKEKRIGAVSLFADLLSSSSGGGRGGLEVTPKWVSITASGLLSAFSRHTQDEEELGRVTAALGAVLAANGVSAYHLNCQLYVLSSISARSALAGGTDTDKSTDAGMSAAALRDLERRGLDLLDHAGVGIHSDGEQVERAAGYNAMVLALCNSAMADAHAQASTSASASASVSAAGAGAGAEAVSRASDVLLEMIGNGHAVTVPTWIALLRASCAAADEQAVLKVLRLCERNFNTGGNSTSGGGGTSLQSQEEPHELALARLFAYAHVRRGYDSLEILRQMRPRPAPRGGQRLRSNLGVISFTDDADPDSGGGRQARGRHIYHRVITALYHARPARDNDWMVARNPASTADFILREMHRDGIAASPATMSALLSLFTKAASIASSSKSGIDGGKVKAEYHLHKAIEFVDHCSSIGGHKGHRPIPVTSSAVRELVRACCVSGLEDQAVSLLTGTEGPAGGGATEAMDIALAGSRRSALRSPLTTARVTGISGSGGESDMDTSLPGIKAVAKDPTCWEPLVYYFAAVRGAEVAAEDALTLMLNMGLTPTTRIADACILGLLRQPSTELQTSSGDNDGLEVGDVYAGGRMTQPGNVAISEAIDRAQDFYNQHSVRPSLQVLTSLRRLTDEAGDSYEAERCDQVISYLYGSDT